MAVQEILEVEGWDQTQINKALELWKRALPGKEESILKILKPFAEPSFRMKGRGASFSAQYERQIFPLIERARVVRSAELVVMRLMHVELLSLGFKLVYEYDIKADVLLPGRSPIAAALWETFRPNLLAIWRACHGDPSYWRGFQWMHTRPPQGGLENAMRYSLIQVSEPLENFGNVYLEKSVPHVLWYNLWTTAFVYCLSLTEPRADKPWPDLFPLLERFRTGTVPLGECPSGTFNYLRY